MGFIDPKKAIIPLTSVAEILNIKIRTLRMYQDKGILPLHEGSEKKLYSLEDIDEIAYIHYLASYRKINANGIKYILYTFENFISEEHREQIIKSIKKEFEESPKADFDASLSL